MSKTSTATTKFMQVVQQMIENRVTDVHTALPGIVDSYDDTTQIAEVTPAVKRVLKNGKEVILPKCTSVPILFPGGGNAVIKFPIEKGDLVLLVFCERSIDDVVVSGRLSNPNQKRKHSLSDAVAIPGLLPRSGSYTGASIVIEKNGTVDINNGNLTVAL